jgi:hypothetical protein
VDKKVDKRLDKQVDKGQRDLLLRETVDELRDLFLIDSTFPVQWAPEEKKPTWLRRVWNYLFPKEAP